MNLSPAVAAAFDAAPMPAKTGMQKLRELILQVAADLPEIGEVTETLRWGQPAYVTSERAGASLRLGVPKTGGFALYTHCQTSLIADFSSMFPNMDTVEGTRAIHFTDPAQINPARHGLLIKAILTYHL